jgi:soluble lytic murein transglycosylase-like protein
MRIFCALLLGFCCLAAAPRARADIYAFTDEQGVTHYTNMPDDPRYALLIKAPPEPRAERSLVAATIKGDWRERAKTYSGMIDKAARTAAVHPALVRAVIAVESAFDPRAVSRAGAQGLMQLLPATARRYGVGNPFDPEQNVRGGATYLSYLLKRYNNNIELALAAYNAGEDAVDRYGKTIPPYRETREYVPAVLRMYKQFLTRAT